MSRSHLNRLIKKDAAPAVREILRLMGCAAGIYDSCGMLLAGVEAGCECAEAAVSLEGKVIGKVRGSRAAAPAANLLSFLLEEEIRKKRLVTEALDKDSDIRLLKEMAEKMADAEDLTEVAACVVDEATAAIESTGASVMLINEKTGKLEIVAAFGKKFSPRPVLKPGVGIVGEVILTGRGEIVNDAQSDARFVPGSYKISSLMCEPIVFKEDVIGAINVSSARPMNYRAADQRLLNLLASQAASAIVSARKMEQLRAEMPLPEAVTASSEPFSIGLESGALNIPSEPPATPPPKDAPRSPGDEAKEMGIPESLMDCFGKMQGSTLEPGDACHENMAVLFSDIRSFSEHMGSMNPRQNVDFLTRYVKCIRPVVARYGGFVAQWVGDGQMILFPETKTGVADNALKAAIDIQKKVGEFSRVQEDALRLPVAVGMGLCVGPLTLGVIGFDSGLISTVIGDTVTAASRMERLTKRFGIKVAVSERFVASLKNRSLFTFREIDLVELPGLEKTFSVYEVINADPDGVRAAKTQCIGAFKDAVEKYRAGEFTQALRMFEKLKSHMPFDRVTDIYLGRCAAFLRNSPPKGWVGVYRLVE
ncbi:MAG: GAF domain-containing protein [Deltaproteobacteria bacterium]|nr:GAF domain-containing protein [Deltaproteobacteria bacterium]